jgi:hypothetical protein
MIPVIVCWLGCSGSNLMYAGDPGNGGTGNTTQTAGTGGNGGGGMGGTVSTPTERCPEGDVAYVGDPAGNVRVCGGQTRHRASGNACPWAPSTTPIATTTPGDECLRGTDCVAQPYGRCVTPNGGGGMTGSRCAYGCSTDAECGSGRVCHCASWGGTCVTASCATDADCAAGKLCLEFYPGPIYTCEADISQCSDQGVRACGDGKVCYLAGDRWGCLPAGFGSTLP